MIARVLLAAIFAGALSGVFAFAAQSYRVIPLILEAETYENAAGGASAGHQDQAQTVAGAHAHEQAGQGHPHEVEAWAPADGGERSGYTLLADVVAGIAFSLILTAGILAANRAISLQSGLVWGASGFVAFVLAPNLGLPPELPGMPAGDLVARQVWWIATVALTAGGLWLFAFRRGLAWMLLGVALIVAPHVWGAPQPESHGSAVPAALAAQFAIATVVTSALFWLALGGLLGHLLGRAVREPAA
jgi:cobalt transporter subunit CbtA